MGSLVELAISWPVWLEDQIPLKLHIVGKAVQVDGRQTTVQISRYEFRTAARRAANRSRVDSKPPKSTVSAAVAAVGS